MRQKGVTIKPGMRFEYLTVVRMLPERARNGSILWECLCDCGNITTAYAPNLRASNTLSCGCYHKKRNSESKMIHGHATKEFGQTRTYKAWAEMIRRCTDETRERYPRYGGRGISVCSQWLTSFEEFLKDMGSCPDGFSLERREVDGNYEPDNCLWIPRKDQAKNKSNSHWITIDGETKILADWMRIAGTSANTFYKRTARGASPKQALGLEGVV
jgi:hypothetical protein